MKYTQKSFSSGPVTDAYRDNYDRIFRSKKDPSQQCGAVHERTRCILLVDHAGAHWALVDIGDIAGANVRWDS